ncbi:MAG: hypothetical protein IIT39_05665 [Clostridia bacterium]|nr:hypothetical protein [Clostridia bacterium]
MARKRTQSDTYSDRPKQIPARSPEARENQMIALAVDLAEKQLIEGTASAQVITHYLKLGTLKEQLEREKLEKENELLKAKTEAIQSAQRVEELYSNALEAMRRYSGDYADYE